ncbi:protein kinase domain-containing protein [Ilumatobacter sp.]|uniref:protein kinase domain-containing protein n=1 Tax=Ilumatobacter sp. TaxID=1967498 RepID=UPI003F6CDB61
MTDQETSRNDRLEDLVAEALDQLADGRSLNLEALCQDDPELREEVKEALALAEGSTFTSATKAPGSLAGRVFDRRYVLSECIGSGAMGAVYRADDVDLRRSVAVKVLRTEMLHGDENERRFEREGEVLAQLNHSSIATIYDRKQSEEGVPYIVMEYLDGISMQHALDDRKALGKEGRMPVREAVEHVTKLARALELVHEKDIVHRDIKPSNIMLANRGPVLIDFGIAALSSQETLADNTRGVGTPAYMAPEQLRGGKNVGPSVDIYGLTASLYRALTGNAPYEGTPAEVLAAIPVRDPELPATLRPDLPRDLLAILDVGLNRDVARRYETMTELREDLEAFLAHEPVKARYPGKVGLLVRRVRRSPVALTAIVAVLVFALGLLGFWGYSELEHNRRTRMQAAYDDVDVQFQPMLGLWNQADRKILNDEERERERALLDTATTNAWQPVPSFVLRAAFLWDHDDREAAVADMQTIVDRQPSKVASFLCDAYRNAGADDALPNIDGAPEPETAEEIYMLAYHEVRRRNFKVVKELLLDPRVDGFDAALEQRLLMRMDMLNRRAEAERIAGARKIHAAVLQMQERDGRATAMTAHLEGLALLQQQRYEEAFEAISGGLELAPYSANLLENAGVALRRSGRLDEAQAQLEMSIKHRPHAKASYETLFGVHMDRLRLGSETAADEAAALLQSETFPPAARRRLRGEIDFARAIKFHRDGLFSQAQRAAEQALPALSPKRYPFRAPVAACLAEGRHPFTEAALIAARDSSNWGRVLLAFDLMPQGSLTAEQSEAAVKLFSELVHNQIPASLKVDGEPVDLSSKR